ncbi:Nucleic acid-binding protein [Corchorus olitorius]|uniref:Nucleic acid-binding protein n=1 Tax=Corchorus olitorius TaxID=93759 RepID=A0A1R3KMX1_9ROSI|nr:Nucleic acid-binding protein [Corchorus olitorius]
MVSNVQSVYRTLPIVFINSLIRLFIAIDIPAPPIIAVDIATPPKQIGLAQLRDGGQRDFIVVKIVRLWDSIIPPRNIFTGIDFLAVDDQAFAIHGTIPADLADDFRQKITEGHVYKIEIFEVGPRGRKTHIAIPVETLIYFNVATIVELVTQGINDILPHYFRFASYDEFMSRNERLFHLTDVIGVLIAATDVKPVVLHNNRGTVDKREIFLSMPDGHKIKIIVWDPKISELDITRILRLGYKPVLAIAGIFIKDNQTYKQINTCSGTKFLLDPDLPETLEIRKSIPIAGAGIELLSTDDFDNLKDYTYPDAKDKRIQDLLYMNAATIKGVRFRVRGKIMKFHTKQGCFLLHLDQIVLHISGPYTVSLFFYFFYSLKTDQGYSPGLNFKVLYFLPVEEDQAITHARKGKGKSSSSSDNMHQSKANNNVGSNTDSLPDNHTEMTVTPHGQSHFSGEDTTPNETPNESLTGVGSESSQHASKKIKTW